MGVVVPVQETHVSRPTGKLIAVQWKHEYLRYALLGAILVFSIIVMFTSLNHRAAVKNVTIVNDGVATVVQTRVGDVAGLLEELRIDLAPTDLLSMEPGTPLENGSRVVIDRTTSVTVKVDGKTVTKFTAADSVGAALKDMNISVDEDDRVIPSPDSPLRDAMNIRVVRVERKLTESSKPIAFKVVQQKNAFLEVGKQKVVKTGKEGVLVYTTERVYEDGKLVSKEVVDRSVAKPAVQQIVAIGTKKKPEVTVLSYNGPPTSAEAQTVKLNGKSVKVKRVLSNVTLTAYSAGFASTGKKKGHPEYGVTASGTTVSEGRTIAVDPDVIPLGWWVYIEGIGFRRAEDTGSAINGKKIDVYYESEKHANRFGRKSGFKVYVIGPVKPSST